MGLFYKGSIKDSGLLYRVSLLRAFNLFILIFYSYELYLSKHTEGQVARVIYVFAVCYLGYLSHYIILHFVHKRYGRKREVEGKVYHTETYQTRLMSIFSAVIIFILVLVASLNILHLNSLLEAGGVVGIIGVFLALTQSAWAPDIFSGLIILNSRMLEEGDVIEMGGLTGMIAVVYKTKVFHTELLNLINNHRVMMKNSRLREEIIYNLSKFASAKGLREKLLFNISYEEDPERVREMFNLAYTHAEESGEINIEYQYPLEIGIEETADDAVQWAIYYYIKDVRGLVKIRMALREMILKQSAEMGVSLATPRLLALQSEQKGPNNPAV